MLAIGVIAIVKSVLARVRRLCAREPVGDGILPQLGGSIPVDDSDLLLDSTPNPIQTPYGHPHIVFDGTNPSTFSNDFDGSGFDIMEMDGLDTFLAADYIVDDMALDPIDWSKLDDWLAHVT